MKKKILIKELMMHDSKGKRKSPVSPGELLKNYAESYVQVHNLPLTLLNEVPRKWEKYGDFVLFDSGSFTNELWNICGEEFWVNVCAILKCKRLALKNKIQKDDYRTPNVKFLIGSNPWITYIDNGIKYTWNVERNMFCAGNASERHRVAKLDCRDEVVVDLYAGIGYFVLPFILRAGAKVVHACDWNPDAIIALKRNLALNGVEDKCVVHEGDNRIVSPKGIADRVNLGLIPSSEQSWRVACEALKPSGGILHIHGNVETLHVDIQCGKCSDLVTQIDPNSKISFEHNRPMCAKWGFRWKHAQWMIWTVHVLHSLSSIAREINPPRNWICTVENVHNIKSYAPHVNHLVLDVSVKNQ